MPYPGEKESWNVFNSLECFAHDASTPNELSISFRLNGIPDPILQDLLKLLVSLGKDQLLVTFDMRADKIAIVFR